MQRWLNSGQIEPPDPDLAAEQYEMACIAMAGCRSGALRNLQLGVAGTRMQTQFIVLAQ